MKKRFNLATVLALLLLVCVSTYLMTRRMAQQSMNENLDYMKQIEQDTLRFREARDSIMERFIVECDPETLNEGAIQGMVAALGDQWSSYKSQEEYEQGKNDNADIVGIGVVVPQLEDDQAPLVITEVYPSSPAADAGLKAGDEIVAVDGTPVTELGRVEAIKRIRGDEYTTVTVTVRRDGQDTEYSIIRRQFNQQLVYSEILEGGDLGYIRIQQFESRVDADFEEAVKQLQQANVKGLILDVRDNPGGGVVLMSSMLDLLLPRGRLITLENRNGTQDVKESNASCVELPMVVLINGNSYSAAEFFAACLSEYDWAETVGEPTTGKGYAQEDIELKLGGGALHLSVWRYFTPKGLSLAGVGLTPDHLVELSEAERKPISSDHTGDRQFEKAAEVLRGIITEREAAE